MWKNVGGLQAHLLSENIYQFGEVELTDEDIALIRQTCNVITGLMAASITDYFDKREKEEKGNED